MSYAIIAIGGKQYRVREGERILVDRLREDEGATITPTVLLVGGDGSTDLAPEGVEVTARVVGHVLGDKIRIGKYKRRTGYRRHAGFRASLSQIEIEQIGSARAERPRRAPKATPEPAQAPETPAETPPPADTSAAALPEGYAGMTVTQIATAAQTWDRAALEAALAYERDHSARKGALAALESALAAKEEQS